MKTAPGGQSSEEVADEINEFVENKDGKESETIETACWNELILMTHRISK